MLYRIEKFLLTALLRTIGILPLCVHHFNARWIGWLLEHVIKYRTGIARDNIYHSFPDKTEAERAEICHKFYRHFADIFVETIWFGACRNPKRLQRAGLVRLVNPELLNEMFENCPSFVIMNSHAGNWEIQGGIESYADGRLHFGEKEYCVVYRRQSSRLWNDFLAENRKAPIVDRKGYQGYLESKEVLMYMMRNKDKKKVYNFNTDQRPYFNFDKSPIITFLNRQCRIMDAAASIAHRLHLGVAYQRMSIEDNHYRLEFVKICDDAATMEVSEIMRIYYELLENDIRRQPHNYLWTHYRWRI